MKLQWSIQSRHTQLALDNVTHLNYRNIHTWPPTKKTWVQYLWSFLFGSMFNISFDLFESTHLIVRSMPEIFYIWLWWVNLWLFGHHTILFFFPKKSSLNVNLQIKRNIELQKPVAHTSIWLGKKERDQKYKTVWCPKSQKLTHQSEISKISSINLTMRCIVSKISNDMSNMEPNEKLQRYCT